MNGNLRTIIERGSFTNSNDLQKLVDALDKRIARIRKDLYKPNARTTLLMDELNRASIYRDEFEALKNLL